MDKPKRNYPMRECLHCGKTRTIHRRGLCATCRKKLDDAGCITVDGVEHYYPKRVQSTDALLDFYVTHRDSMTTAEMAAAFGIKPKSFCSQIGRARKKGDSRAKSIVEVTQGKCFVTRQRASTDGRWD